MIGLTRRRASHPLAKWAAAAVAVGSLLSAGCSMPSALMPTLRGSVGLPHTGFLVGGVELPREGPGFRWKSSADHHFGTAGLVSLIQEAAGQVDRERPGGAGLVVGELSGKNGGQLFPKHRSHRTGRDVDLLFYVASVDGAPLSGSTFARISADGLGVGEGGRFVRLDVDRQWRLVRSLVSSKKAHIQWIFVSRVIEALLVEHALALGEPADVISRAEQVMQQPGDSLPHDDHMHVRIACETDDFVTGCDGGGPRWSWLPKPPKPVELTEKERVDALLEPLVRP